MDDCWYWQTDLKYVDKNKIRPQLYLEAYSVTNSYVRNFVLKISLSRVYYLGNYRE